MHTCHPKHASDGECIEADASMENSAPVLFDALVLPDGAAGVRTIAADGHTMEFVTNQYRHCKTILAFGASRQLLEKAGISPTLPNGKTDNALLLLGSDDAGAADAFMASVARHRNHDRESDPPVI
jgi:catalase